ncbi:MAG: right-handed parallel beta-helix repeat-containing protein, partial [Planctomycetes bacterium]|nr:right-handed parallel beta-helix repeat-containing protein [Planctomycetota bacterium]
VYRPDATGLGDSRQATFRLAADVTLRGGYAGLGQPDPDLRDLVLHETILSGDLAGDDDIGGNSENAYHVVTAEGVKATAGLDGLTVTAGNADGAAFPHYYGGGLFLLNASPTLIDCTFRDNRSSRAPSVTGGGGGIYARLDCSPTLIRCAFLGNEATFGSGGAYQTQLGGSPLLIDCTFLYNRAVTGGAFGNDAAKPTFLNCRFHGNAAETRGGALESAGVGAELHLINCALIGNWALQYGAGVYTAGGSVVLTNCAVVANRVEIQGGGLRMLSGTEVTIANSIIWANEDGFIPADGVQAAQLRIADGAALAVNYTCLEGWSGTLGGQGNIGLAPLFTRDPDDGGDGWIFGDNDDFGDLTLQGDSPAIDAGDNAALPPDLADLDQDGDLAEPPPLDLAGGPRVLNARVDMGPLEFPTDCNSNGVRDDLDIAGGTSRDCTGNAVPDECDLANGTNADCNANGTPDSCDLADRSSGDCDGNERPDECQPDADGDGVPDTCDLCPGRDDLADNDGDATADCLEACPADPGKTEPGTCGCGMADTDRDADGVADCVDGCPDDPKKTAAGPCGCGRPDVDEDGDSVLDCFDECPAEENPTGDDDDDGTFNCFDECPRDANKLEPGVCGCGVADTDTDGDGRADCPPSPVEDTNAAGTDGLDGVDGLPGEQLPSQPTPETDDGTGSGDDEAGGGQDGDGTSPGAIGRRGHPPRATICGVLGVTNLAFTMVGLAGLYRLGSLRRRRRG